MISSLIRVVQGVSRSQEYSDNQVDPTHRFAIFRTEYLTTPRSSFSKKLLTVNRYILTVADLAQFFPHVNSKLILKIYYFCTD